MSTPPRELVEVWNAARVRYNARSMDGDVAPGGSPYCLLMKGPR